jgi:hypothetical protein
MAYQLTAGKIEARLAGVQTNSNRVNPSRVHGV